MSETPNLKKLFENDEGLAYVHILNDKFIIHSFSKVGWTPDTLKKAFFYSNQIDDAFRERGVKTLHTWGYTEEHDRYNMFLGYFPTGLEVFIENWDGPPIYEYAKEL